MQIQIILPIFDGFNGTTFDLDQLDVSNYESTKLQTEVANIICYNVKRSLMDFKLIKSLKFDGLVDGYENDKLIACTVSFDKSNIDRIIDILSEYYTEWELYGGGSPTIESMTMDPEECYRVFDFILHSALEIADHKLIQQITYPDQFMELIEEKINLDKF